jgi:AraC-like DNA-binding protein
MPRHPDLSKEIHNFGDDSVITTVRAEHCDALAARDIAHVAVIDAVSPYTIVRTNLSGAYLQVCLGGEGQTLLDGRWYAHREAAASFAPAHALHALHCVPGKHWKLAWVRFTPTSPYSRSSAMGPRMMRFSGVGLEHAILGLASEMNAGTADHATCAMWVSLIERYAERVVEPWREEPRLMRVWDVVRADLGRDWNLTELAALANTSEEHLRRMCQKCFGRSPGKQLTSIRIAHAAHLLATTQDKIDAIAHSVGYVNPFAFSNTFKKLTGFRPSDYRSHPRATHHSLDSQPGRNPVEVVRKR